MDPREIANLITEDPDVPLTEGRRIKDALSGLTRELMKQIFPELLKYYKEHDNKSPNLWPTSELFEVDRKRIYQAVQNPIAKLTLARLKYFGFQPGTNFRGQWNPNYRIIALNPESFAHGWSPRKEHWETIRRVVDKTIRHELEHTFQSVMSDDEDFQAYTTHDEDLAGYYSQPVELDAHASDIARYALKSHSDPEDIIKIKLWDLQNHPDYERIFQLLLQATKKRLAQIKRPGRSKKRRKEEQQRIKAREARRRGEKVCEVCGKPTNQWHEDGYYYCGCDD